MLHALAVSPLRAGDKNRVFPALSGYERLGSGVNSNSDRSAARPPGPNHATRNRRVDSADRRWYTKRLSEGNSLIVHKSAIKRHRQSLKRRERNIETKSKLRTLIKRARQAIETKNQETASAQIQAVNKALGKAVSKGIIKRNTASRWLSRLSRSAGRMSAAG